VSELLQAQWSIQGVSFVSDLKVLPLPYYDIIVGMDWLESHRPMRVDWLNKWMTVTQNGMSVQLHGLQPAMLECSMIEVLLVDNPKHAPSISCCMQSDVAFIVRIITSTMVYLGCVFCI
jgi:hypothetical protein